MNNFKIKSLSVLVPLLFLLQSCAKADDQRIAKCFEERSEMSVVRIDEKNHRLFVVPNQPSQEAIISRLNSSAECFKKSSWSNDWSVSLFINKKYAGYKDEPKIIEYHQNNEWAKAYIGEFDGPSKTYTKSPALKP